MDVRRALIVALAAALVACDAEPIPAAPDAGPEAGAPDPCSTEAPPAWCTATTNDPGKGCAYDVADGVCVPFGPSADTCDCVDCAPLARCNGSCVDDGFCDLTPGSAEEDCSCGDCFRNVQACAPAPVGCKDDGVCGRDDDCTCPDCDGDPRCRDCVDNRECVPFDEGCGCTDCAGRPVCLRDGGADAGADASAP